VRFNSFHADGEASDGRFDLNSASAAHRNLAVWFGSDDRLHILPGDEKQTTDCYRDNRR